MNEDIAVVEVRKRIAEAKAAIQRAWHALDGVEDARIRKDLEYEIINVAEGVQS